MIQSSSPVDEIGQRSPLNLNCSVPGARFLLRGPEWSSAVEPITQALRRYGSAASEFRVLKDHRQRPVLLYSSRCGPLVIKVRRPRKWYSRLRHRRDMWREALTTLSATAAGLPIPSVVGYGTVGGGSAVMLQHYHALPTMRDVLLSHVAGSETLDREALLARAATSLIRLVNAGWHHVDFGPHAILLADRPGQPDRLIDFEHAQFWRRPSARLAAVMGGYFAWSSGTNRDWFTEQALVDWFRRVLDQLGFEPSSEIWDLWHRCREVRQPLRWRTELR